jgi:hypothetical protein
MGPSDDGHAFLAHRQDEADLRASDSERDLVAAELGEHFQSGRLDQTEFDERLTLALRARTRRDLARLLTDLPAWHPVPVASPEPARPDPGVRLAPVLIPLLFVVVVGSTISAHGGAGSWSALVPLLWVWWVILLVAFRGRHRQGR